METVIHTMTHNLCHMKDEVNPWEMGAKIWNNLSSPSMVHGPAQRNIHEKREEQRWSTGGSCCASGTPAKRDSLLWKVYFVLLVRQYSPVSETNLLLVPAPKASTSHHKMVVICTEGVGVGWQPAEIFLNQRRRKNGRNIFWKHLRNKANNTSY